VESFVAGHRRQIAPECKSNLHEFIFSTRAGMRSLLVDIPVKIVLNDSCGITGAARYTLFKKGSKPDSSSACSAILEPPSA